LASHGPRRCGSGRGSSGAAWASAPGLPSPRRPLDVHPGRASVSSGTTSSSLYDAGGEGSGAYWQRKGRTAVSEGAGSARRLMRCRPHPNSSKISTLPFLCHPCLTIVLPCWNLDANNFVVAAFGECFHRCRPTRPQCLTMALCI
jgi:hypothetical protein